MAELKRFEPKLYQAALVAFQAADQLILNKALSEKIPSKSIDYAVLERSELIKVVPASFDWSDMGAFDSLFAYFKSKGHPIDENGNIVVGTNVPSYFVGLQNCMLVHTEDAILVLDRSKAQDVKEIYEQLDKAGSSLVD